MLLDDTGFAQFGCYGSDIDTPNVDRLAAMGLQFTNFHVTLLCSPTRASLAHRPLGPRSEDAGGVELADDGGAAAVVTAGDTVPCAGLDTLCQGVDALVHTVIREDMHGEPSWSYLYRSMVPPLAAAGHRVIVPERRPLPPGGRRPSGGPAAHRRDR